MKNNASRRRIIKPLHRVAAQCVNVHSRVIEQQIRLLIEGHSVLYKLMNLLVQWLVVEAVSGDVGISPCHSESSIILRKRIKGPGHGMEWHVPP